MNLKSISDQDLILNTKTLAGEERRIGLQVLHHLKEIEARKLFLDRGYPSLFEMCIQEFRYSNGAAQRRISAMRLLKEVPALEEKIESGKISLSVAAQVQSFLKAEKQKEVSYSLPEKLELLEALENKSSREAEKELVKRNPEVFKRKETLRPLSENEFELTMVISKELNEKLATLMALQSNKNPDLRYSVLLEEMADLLLKKSLASEAAVPQYKKAKNSKRQRLQAKHSDLEDMNSVLPTSEVEWLKGRGPFGRSRYIPRKTKKYIWNRDQGQCCYIDPMTGKKCGTKNFLQFDHMKRFADGGPNTQANLRLLCGAHNRHREGC